MSPINTKACSLYPCDRAPYPYRRYIYLTGRTYIHGRVSEGEESTVNGQALHLDPAEFAACSREPYRRLWRNVAPFAVAFLLLTWYSLLTWFPYCEDEARQEPPQAALPLHRRLHPPISEIYIRRLLVYLYRSLALYMWPYGPVLRRGD
jgi:hypothetical protein